MGGTAWSPKPQALTTDVAECLYLERRCSCGILATVPQTIDLPEAEHNLAKQAAEAQYCGKTDLSVLP